MAISSTRAELAAFGAPILAPTNPGHLVTDREALGLAALRIPAT